MTVGTTCLHAGVPAFAEAATRRQALRHAGVAISAYGDGEGTVIASLRSQ